MKSPVKFFRKLLKNKKAVSQVLAAIMMIIMLTAAIGVVWGWLFPSYRRFQANNAINSVTSYMLRIDEGVYSLLSEGTGAITTLNLDPFFGTYQYESGKNITIDFNDDGGTYSSSFDYLNLGAFTYTIIGRQSSLLPVGDFEYLKGPSSQPLFFVNNSEAEVYQGLTNLTSSRPTNEESRLELDYRVSLYYWYDQVNDVLSISLNLIILAIKGTAFQLYSFNALKMNYNQTKILYSDSTTVSSDFFVDGTITSHETPATQRVLDFTLPSAVVNYDVNIEVKASYIVFYT
ncbi:MAG: hypothetical protein EAX90_05095 [Candidatus Heimdallarchaeota archaeon]|nr:hypothetical protein [Candidatus Heimdallarchaeota archaeon]